MTDSAISREQMEIVIEAALRQLESGRSLDDVLTALAAKGYPPEEAKDIGEKAYKIYTEKLEEARNNPRCLNCEQNVPEEGYSTALCPGCRDKLAARPWPIWVKLAAVAVLLLFAAACSDIPSSFAARLAFERGLRAERSRNYPLAISEYQKAQARFPDSTKILARETVAYFKANDLKSAAATVKKLQGRKVDKETATEINSVIDQINKKVRP